MEAAGYAIRWNWATGQINDIFWLAKMLRQMSELESELIMLKLVRAKSQRTKENSLVYWDRISENLDETKNKSSSKYLMKPIWS